MESHMGSVLPPIMFVIYINDMPGVRSFISLFAGSAESLRKIRNKKDCEEMQKDINTTITINLTIIADLREKVSSYLRILQ